jgi:hypothetical protein
MYPIFLSIYPNDRTTSRNWRSGIQNPESRSKEFSFSCTDCALKIRHKFTTKNSFWGDCMSVIPSSLRRRIRSHISIIAPPVKRLLSPGHSSNLPRSGICPSSAVVLFPFYDAFVPRSKTCSGSSGDFKKTSPMPQDH